MTKYFSSIYEIKHIREQKIILSKREKELSTPTLSDFTLIHEIYEWFKEIISTTAPYIVNVTQRKEFFFIVLFFFAPSVLAGGRLPNGVRDELSRVFPNISPCVISNNISDILFLYKQYKEVREEIDKIYVEIANRLKAKGLIN